MAPSYEQILKVCEILSENESLPVTIKQTAKGAAITASGTILGGLLAGPIGLGIGGAMSSVAAYFCTRKTFKSVTHILRHEMTQEQQGRLCAAVIEIIQNIRAEDAIAILAILNSNPLMRASVLFKIKDFIQKQVL